MADSDGIASLKAEENEVNDDNRIVSIGDIAEAAGLDSSSFFESANSEPEPVEAEETEETEEVAEQVEEPTEDPITTEEVEEEVLEEPKLEESDGVKKRIGKLIEARNNAEAEAEELKAKIAELESAPNQVVPDTKGLEKFDGVKDFKELQAREAEAEHLRDWLIENPDGGEYTDITGAEHEVEYGQARRLMVETDRDLRKNIPQAGQRLQQKEQNRQTAMQTFEWMKDKQSPEMLEIQQVLNANPYIKDYYNRDPYAVLTVAYAIEGIKTVNARKAQKPVKQSAAPKAPVPSRASPSVVRKKGVSKKSLLQQASSGSVEDASSYIESIL
tara:strand:- start:13132 stop:14121 length:990 start_codon:yes stop_codon:yes gene_type:complete